MTSTTGLASATALADAVLYYDDLLGPRRAAAPEELRWPCGLLVPVGTVSATGGSASCQAECLLEPGPDAGAAGPGCWDGLGTVHARVRFLRLVDRSVWTHRAGRLVPAAAVRTTRGETRPGRETTLHEDDALVALADLLPPPGNGAPQPGSREPEPWVIPVTAPAGRDAEPAGDDLAAFVHACDEAVVVATDPADRVVWDWGRVDGQLRLSARWVPGPYRLARLRAELVNTSSFSPCEDAQAVRGEALRHAMIGAYLVLSVPGWRFLSLTDPPAWAGRYAAECHNDQLWPALVSGDGAGRLDDTVLATPVVLPDHPSLPEAGLAATPRRREESAAPARPAPRRRVEASPAELDALESYLRREPPGARGRPAAGGLGVAQGSRVLVTPLAGPGDAGSTSRGARGATVTEVGRLGDATRLTVVLDDEVPRGSAPRRRLGPDALEPQVARWEGEGGADVAGSSPTAPVTRRPAMLDGLPQQLARWENEGGRVVP